ncbi:magnesium transporter, partial [Candidatus Bathyarchaeota archaeon]|nr:magnesium transporter [Candidatus Bathyarchaeota archaeon]
YESIPVLTVSVLIETLAGATLGMQVGFLISIPVFLMLIPPLNDLGNDIGCIISSRIASALHLGTIKVKIKKSPVLTENVIAILIVGALSSLYLGVMTYMLADLIGEAGIPFGLVIFVSLLAGTLLSALTICFSTLIAFISWYKGLDPCNVVIPIVTSVADVIGVYCLFLAISIAT